MREREIRTAERFNIMDNVKKLESELLSIDGLKKVEYDLDGFYDDLNQVIFLTRYDIPYEDRKQFIEQVLEVAKNNGLTKTEDRIEDYGASFYFVFKCDNS